MANKRANYKQESTGLRVVEFYVTNQFDWGWQTYDQKNDKGIDGIIIVRDKDGNDVGKINVQVKCGESYEKKKRDEYIHIAPYHDKENLKSHLEYYNKLEGPIILIYVNSKTDQYKIKDKDRMLPEAFWVDLTDYHYNDSHLIPIPIKNRFGSHSKGDLSKIVKPYIKQWTAYQAITANSEAFKLWNSMNLWKDSINYYKKLKEEELYVTFYGQEKRVSFTRMGWRNIVNPKRSHSVRINSLKSIAIVKQILESKPELLYQLKPSKKLEDCKSLEELYCIRKRVKFETNGEYQKVQIVIRRHIFKEFGMNEETFWFYGIHIIK